MAAPAAILGHPVQYFSPSARFTRSTPPARRQWPTIFSVALCAGVLFGCSADSDDPGPTDPSSDAQDVSTLDDAAVDDTGMSDTGMSDTALSDTAGDAGTDVMSDSMEDVADDTDDTSDTGPERQYTGRSIGGISMGAMAANIALMNPGTFDMVGSLGGYIDLRYMVTAGLRLHFAGFCDLDHLEANLEHINDIDADPSVVCGPADPLYELEVAQDFNHLHHDDNGAGFNRGFYMRVFRALTQAAGNFTSEPTGNSPYLPAGIDDEWLLETTSEARCAAAEPIPAALSYNAEYNPNADYPVIPLCDSDKRVLDGLGEADFDPTVNHTKSSDILLAVDLNDNGKRDYGEPLFVNAHERYDDTGSDGCFDAREDGQGGCLDESAPNADGEDPNGDNFHWWDRPTGTEGNVWRDEGESFADLGLDGVADTGDPGEGNGTYDTTTAFERARQFDARTLLSQTSDEELARLDFYFDAGIRDTLHAAVSMRRVVGLLNERVPMGVTLYGGVAGRPGTMWPDTHPDEYIESVQTSALVADEVGRHTYVEYGNPDATQEEIDDGDGKHVGNYSQAINRVLNFIMLAGSRIPEPDIAPATASLAGGEPYDFYSEGLKARREYYVTLPPDYDVDTNKHYPVIYFLHGLGQAPGDMSTVSILTSGFMSQGRMPKAILVFPDGQCCYKNIKTGERECACGNAKAGQRACIDPTCTGPQGTCEVRDIPTEDLVEECYGGSLYLDLVANRWGEQVDGLAYGQSVIDLVAEVDARFRTLANAPDGP